MSASRDKSQKVTFVFQNLHQVYRKGLEAAKAAPVAAPTPAEAERLTGVIRGRVIKAYESHTHLPSHEPVELIGKRVERESAVVQASSLTTQRQALESLQSNLKTLGDLHSRLRFMLKELEDLVKE